MVKKLPNKIYLDAGRLLPHLDHAQFPGQSLAAGLYLEGGIRGVEIGSLMFAYPHPDTGEVIYPQLELVHLAIPRRVYTQSHIDYVVKIMAHLAERKDKLAGYRLVYAPPLLRHFTARLEPIP